MKRRILSVVIVLFLMLVSLVTTLGWIISTSEGSRRLIDIILKKSSYSLVIGAVEGRLADRLVLRNVRVSLPDEDISIETIDLTWKPAMLLIGFVDIRDLHIVKAEIDYHPVGTRKPLDIAWPRVSGIAARLKGSIRRLTISEVTYRRPHEKPITLGLTTTARWWDGVLTMENISLMSDIGTAVGNIDLGLRSASLHADIAITLKEAIHEFNSFSVQTKLSRGRGDDIAAGNITLRGRRKGSSRPIQLTGKLGIMRHGFNVKEMELRDFTKSGILLVNGTLMYEKDEPAFSFRIEAKDVNLEDELKSPVVLTGTLTGKGTFSGYSGFFLLLNKENSWRKVTASGSYRGNTKGLTVPDLDAKMLNGTLQGSLNLSLQDTINIQAKLKGTGFDLGSFREGWNGVLNFDLDAAMSKSQGGALQGDIHAILESSLFHNEPLVGEVEATLQPDRLGVKKFVLSGKSFALNASGDSYNGIVARGSIKDMGILFPTAAGEVDIKSSLRVRKKKLNAVLSAKGTDFIHDQIKIKRLALDTRFDQSSEVPLNIHVSLINAQHEPFHADLISLELKGTAVQHTIQTTLHASSRRVWLTLTGAYEQEGWKGTITDFSGLDDVGPWSLRQPAGFEITNQAFRLDSFRLQGTPKELLELSLTRDAQTKKSSLRADWSALRLARFNGLRSAINFSGTSTGKLDIKIFSDQKMNASANMSSSGSIVLADRATHLDANVVIEANEKGIQSAAEMHVGNNGVFKGTFMSSTPAYFTMPESGNLAMEWSGVDLGIARPFVPSGIILAGITSGKVRGTMLKQKRFAVQGDAVLKKGKVSRHAGGEEMGATLRECAVAFNWSEAKISGDFHVGLAENGNADGTFQMPLRAQFPVSFDRAAPLRASVKGRFVEKGLLAAFMPGAVRESHANVDFDLHAVGTISRPEIKGDLRLGNANAYIPMLGIHLRDIALSVHLEDETIRVDSFRAVSTPGEIAGRGAVYMKNMQIARYDGSLDGSKFQAIYLPELQVQVSPQLEFEGRPGYLKVRGEVSLPEVRILGQQTKTVEPSRDVILEGKPAEEKQEALSLDVNVRFLFGDRVFVKVKGIDAQLKGDVTLEMKNLEHITSSGEINVVKGRYKTYGVDLDIVRGRLFYAGGAIGQPTLDILALRKIGDVRAGVTVSGTIQVPVVKLYSEPPMQDVDILAYIVLGHPLGNSSEQAGLMATAAGALVSAGQSVVLQDKIKNRLGLSNLEIGTGPTTTTRYGYKPVTVTPPGTSPAQQSELSQTMVTVGKYLTPQLYVSYGRSLFTGDNRFLLRYDIYKNWQVETQTGTETGVDLYYKIEFE